MRDIMNQNILHRLRLQRAYKILPLVLYALLFFTASAPSLFAASHDGERKEAVAEGKLNENLRHNAQQALQERGIPQGVAEHFAREFRGQLPLRPWINRPLLKPCTKAHGCKSPQ